MFSRARSDPFSDLPILVEGALDGRPDRWWGDRPIVALSDRYPYQDVLWFSFIHEPGHVAPTAPVTPRSVASLAAAVTVPAVFVFVVLWSLSVSAGQVQAAAVVLGAVIMLDVATVILVRRAHGSTGSRRRELELTGAQVLDVALYAAHPRGQGHGRRLLIALLPVMPPTATLLAVAGSDELAKTYIESYRFTRYDPERPYLLECPPTSRPEPTG